MDKNPFDIVDTMKVKNGIQMDGTHKMDSEETDFDDLSSYWETNIFKKFRSFKLC